MTRHPNATQHKRTYEDRRALSMQALLNGWTKLEVLAAFLTETEELIVIDRQLNRYSTSAEAEALAIRASLPVVDEAPRIERVTTGVTYPTGVDPASADPAKVQEILTALAHGAGKITHVRSRLTKHVNEFLAALEIVAATADGPDWRESIGIETVP